MHAILQAMLKAAVDDGVILSNPAEKLGRQLHLVASAATRQEEIKAMIGEQRHLFLTTVAKVEPKHYPLFFARADAGMRPGEGLALQHEDFFQSGRYGEADHSSGVHKIPLWGNGAYEPPPL
jgi:integrase